MKRIELKGKLGYRPYLSALIIVLCASMQSFSQNGDKDLLRKINLNRNPSLDGGFQFLTNTLGTISIATPILVYSVGIVKDNSDLKKDGIFIGESFLVSAIIATSLKYTVKRDRPFVTYPEIQKRTQAGSPSFPSGHTSSAFATATSLSIAFPKWYVIVHSYLWASAVAYSRMDLGVHYPTDVLAGAIIGSGSAILSCELNKWIVKRRDVHCIPVE